MKQFLILLNLIVLLISGCSKQKDSEPKINYNGSAFVKLVASNVIDSINVGTGFYQYFPRSERGIIRENVKIQKDGIYFLETKMIIPTLVDFVINNDSFTTYLIPGDTLEIKLKQESSDSINSFTSYVIDDKIFNYCQNKFKEFGYIHIVDIDGPLRLRWFLKMVTSQEQYSSLIEEADSVETRNITFLEENSTGLPDWFVKMEKSNIIYGIAHCKLVFFGSLTNYSKKINHTFNVPIYNPEAHLSFKYYNFISDYFMHGNLLLNSLVGTPRVISLLNKEYSSIDSTLNGEIKRFFLIGKIAELYCGCRSDAEAIGVDSFILSLDFSLSPNEMKFIERAKNSNHNTTLELNSLKPGDHAPNFDLKDMIGKKFSLSDFKGKIIYLHFWATWCGPCIGELPVLNRLITDIKSNKIVFINVCLDNDYTKWESIIREKQLLGINLICDDNWSKKLNSLYKISVIPHYTLIDENGLIIKNNCVRPGKITTEISQLLDKK
jgi:thiol-disulfide isomerase/thioredoxin